MNVIKFPSILILLIFLLAGGTSFASPKVEQGLLNCIDWNFEENGYLLLDGEWEFYWNQLLSPEDFRTKASILPTPSYATFPELWSKLTINGERLPSRGFATYRLTIKNDTLLPLMAIEMSDVYTAYRLWVNGELVASNGEVGKSRVSTTPYWQPLTRPIKLTNKTNEVVLQIANFHHSKGGINKIPLFGTLNELSRKREIEWAYNFLLAGSLLMGGLFFLGLFLFGRNDRAVLYFSLFCMAYAYRVMGSDLYVLHSLVTWDWALTVRLEYIALFFSTALFIEFLNRLFPKEMYSMALRIFEIFSLTLVFITIVLSPYVFTQIVNIYLIVLTIYMVYGAYIIILATIRQREGGIYALASILVLFLVLILVIGAYFRIVPDMQIVYFTGYILFFFFQSLILSDRFAANFRRATEAAEQGAKTKSEFLATMSHEIRTPMNGIMGMTSLLAQTKLTEEQQDYTETIRVSSESLITIINEILDYSKIESGKMELEKQPFEIEAAVEEILDLLSVKANSKRLNLWYKITREVPPIIIGDVTRIKQILTNLIGNAVKFTDKGEILTNVSIIDEGEHNIELLFRVTDTGIGIPKEKQSLLFEQFSQVDASTTRKYGGTGLGLAISKRLVEMMGGKIWVESDGQAGSTFAFTLRLNKPQVIKPHLFHHDPMEILKDKKVLLIADEPNLVKIIQYHVNFWQADIKVAASVSDTLEMLQGKFDLILIYERLRGVSGIALEKRVRFTAHGKSVPIIILSTSHFESSKAKSHHHFTSFVNNPLKISNLRHNIRTLVLPENKAKHYRAILEKETEALGEKLPLKILIAEDHPINQRLVLFLLKKQGYQADAVSNGQEAIEAVEQQHYDILFMDVQMPILDGLEATRRIVKKYPKYPVRPVIIAMTANAMIGDREDCLAAGMDDYLSKPLKPGIVIETLTKWGTRLQKKDSDTSLF